MSDLPQITLVKYEIQNQHPSCVCNAVVSVNAKMQLTVKICKSKKDGELFACFPSLKIADTWCPSIELDSKLLSRAILERSLELIKPLLSKPDMLGSSPKGMEAQSFPSYNDDLPF